MTVVSQQCHGQQQIWSGDFNRHIGRDMDSDGIHSGNHKLATPTSRNGKQWVERLRTTDLAVVDTSRRCQRRGTWIHRTNGQWYEVDITLSKTAMLKKHQVVRMRGDHGVSDYMAKGTLGRRSGGRGERRASTGNEQGQDSR